MMIAARNAMLMSGSSTPTARDYVQSGLVAMWDGTWNAGGGVHDANATTWTDLSNSGNDLDITAGTWAADHFVCNGASGGKAGFITGIETIEVVFRCVSSSRYQLVIGLDSPSTYYSRYFALTSGVANFASFGPTLAFASGVIQSFSGVIGEAYYRNGVASATGSGASAYYSHGSNNNVIIGIAGTNNYPFGGEIYAIRLYSRALTAAEVAANYAVDAARFGL